jgi:hypothetical protein
VITQKRGQPRSLKTEGSRDYSKERTAMIKNSHDHLKEKGGRDHPKERAAVVII